MAVYVFFCNAQSKSHSDLLDISCLFLFYHLPNCNYFTQHVLFILWRDTTSELWTLVLFPSYCYHLFTLLALFTLFAYYYYFPLDTFIPFVSSKPVRLTTSSQVGNKLFGCVLCRFRIAASKQSLDEAPYINCPKLSQTSKYHLQSHCLLFSPEWYKPWFLNWEKTSCYTHHTFLLGFPTGWSFTTHQALFLAPLSGRRVEDHCKGSFSHIHPLLCYSFILLYLFYLHHFISKTQKKI
jgi:hypothetical protein